MDSVRFVIWGLRSDEFILEDISNVICPIRVSAATDKEEQSDIIYPKLHLWEKNYE